MAEFPESVLRMSMGLLVVLMNGGVIYGYSAFVPMMASVGVFADRCPAAHPRHSASPCPAQRLAFSYMFTAAAFLMSVLGPVWGVVLDRLGGTGSMLLGSALACGSYVLLAVNPGNVAFAAAFAALGGVAPLFYMSAFTLSKSVPRLSSLYNAWLTSAYDGSALVLFVLALLVDHTALSAKTVLAGYAVLTLVVGLCTAVLLPRASHFKAIQARFDTYVGQQSKLLVTAAPDTDGSLQRGASNTSVVDPELSMGSSECAPAAVCRFLLFPLGVSGALTSACRRCCVAVPQDASAASGTAPEPSMWPYVKEIRFVLTTLLMCIMNLKNGFYITTVSKQLEDVLPASHAKPLITFYNVVYPIGGVASLPLSTYLLNRFRFRDDVIFGTVVVLGLLHAVLNLVPHAVPQYMAVVVFAVMRPLKWSSFNDFIGKHYPLQLLGRLMGFPNLFIGFVGLLLIACTWIVTHRLHDHVFWVAFALTCVEALALGVPLWMWCTRRRNPNLKRQPRCC